MFLEFWIILAIIFLIGELLSGGFYLLSIGLGAIAAAILNYLSDVLERPLFRTSSVIDVLRDEDNLNKLIEFIKKAYISDSSMSGSSYFDEKISFEVESRIKQIYQ